MYEYSISCDALRSRPSVVVASWAVTGGSSFTLLILINLLAAPAAPALFLLPKSSDSDRQPSFGSPKPVRLLVATLAYLLLTDFILLCSSASCVVLLSLNTPTCSRYGSGSVLEQCNKDS